MKDVVRAGRTCLGGMVDLIRYVMDQCSLSYTCRSWQRSDTSTAGFPTHETTPTKLSQRLYFLYFTLPA